MVSVIMSTQKQVGCDADVERAACGTLSSLDSGLFKKVYIDENRSTVYKVVKPSHRGYDVRRAAPGQLLCETERAIDLQANGLRGIPDVTLYEASSGMAVLAMTYYPEDAYTAEQHPDFQDIFCEWELHGIDDLHNGNYAADADGNPYVIDLAGWAQGYEDDSVSDDEDEPYCAECDDYHSPCPSEPSYVSEPTPYVKPGQCPCYGVAGGALIEHKRYGHPGCAFGPAPTTVEPTLFERLPHTVAMQRPLWPLFAFVPMP